MRKIIWKYKKPKLRVKVGDSIFTVKFLVALDPGTKISVIEE